MKSKKIFSRSIAMLLALVFCVGMLAACDNSKDPNKSGSEGNNGSSDTPLVVAYQQFSENFSPFFASTGYDQDVAGMTQVGLMTTDRAGAIVYNAIDGETREYNGTPYEYKGLSNIKVELKDEDNDGETDKTVYTLKMKEGVLFSDGHEANIDDVIFYYYVVLDPFFTGGATLSSQNIVGYTEYRYNNSTAGTFDAAGYAEKIDDHEALQTWVKENIIVPVLTEELDWVESLYTNEQYLAVPQYVELFEKYPERKDLFYNGFYGLDAENYDSTAATEEEVLAKVIEEYGYDYKKLAEGYAGDTTYFDSQVIEAAYKIGIEESGEGEPVDHIEGIKRIDDYTVEVTTHGYMATAIYQIGSATIVPMHYYGDESLYDYDNNKFGFNNRAENSMELIETHTTQPMGAGAYKFVEYKDKVVYFEANENYWDGAPKIKHLQFKETSTSDTVAAIATGEADVASDITGSVEKFKEIQGYNSNGEITGDKITTTTVWNLGYGYIGINADEVRVGSDSGSEESKNLRKAIMTVLAVYRDRCIDSYYGDVAAVIEYPISSTSWAAPVPSDPGYQIAYSTKVDGSPIYTDGMTIEERDAAALAAAVEYFVAAGYTYDEASGKLTAAPSGAELSYEFMIPGEGSGDHPNFQILTLAKEALASIGFELKINDLTDSTVLWDAFDAGTQQLFTAAWGSTIDPDMYQVYHSSNIVGKPGASGSNNYHIADAELDELIVEARKSDDQEFRRTTYKTCLDIILDWGVELPAYQRKNVVIFNTAAINMDTLTKDITTYWGWTAEIHKLEMAG